MPGRTFEFVDDIDTKEFYTVDDTRLDEWLSDYIVQDLYGELKDRFRLLSAKSLLEILAVVKEAIDEFQKLETKAFDDIENLLGFFESYKFLRIEFVTGSLANQVKHPRSNVLYVQHDNPADKSWSCWIYNGTEWCAVGDNETLLDDFVLFSQIEEYKDFLYEHLIAVLTDDMIKQTVQECYAEIIAKADAERAS